MENKIIKEGFLTKHKQGLFKAPKKRYFVLNEERIQYFTDIKGQLKGSINISPDLIASKIQYKKQFAIKIETQNMKKNVYILIPEKEDETEVDSWVNSINTLLKTAPKNEGSLHLDNPSSYVGMVAPIPGTSSGFPSKLSEYEDKKLASLETLESGAKYNSYLILLNNTLYCLKVYYEPQQKEFVSCPHVVAVYHSFEDQVEIKGEMVEVFCFVVEFMYGGSLYNYMINNLNSKKDKTKYVRTIVRDVVYGIMETYNNNFYFERLTPENVYINHEGRSKIVNEVNRISASRNSYENIPEYFSPEILSGRPITKDTILWTLGIFIHDIYTCTTPFHADGNCEELYAKIKNEEPQVSPDIPENARNLIVKLLQKDPTKRLGANSNYNDILNDQFLKEDTNDYSLDDIACFIKIECPNFPKINSPQNIDNFVTYYR